MYHRIESRATCYYCPTPHAYDRRCPSRRAYIRTVRRDALVATLTRWLGLA